MASNAKTRARKVKATQKRVGWGMKFRKDLAKGVPAGETRPGHYIGGGQPFTRKTS